MMNRAQRRAYGLTNFPARFSIMAQLHDFAIHGLGMNEMDWYQYTKYVVETGNRILKEVLEERSWKRKNPLMSYAIERQTLLTPSKITFSEGCPCLNIYQN